MKKLISVIVPVYNVENYLDQCVQSIIHQSYTNLEILLINDGSTDSSGKMCDEYALSDPRIRVYHKENGGLSDARNYGLDRCNGEYVVFIDSDDWVAEDYIAYLYGLCQRYEVSLSISELVRITDDGKILNQLINDESELCFSEKEGLCNLLQTKLYSTSACGKMYKREIFDTLRFPKGKLFEDIPVAYSIFLDGIKTVYGSHIGYYYRSREESITTTRFTPRRMDAVEFVYAAMDRVEREYPEFFNEAQKRRFMINFNVIECLGDDEDSRKCWCIIKQEIKKYRKAVLVSASATKLEKIKAAISIFDYHTIQRIMRLYRKLK